MRILVTAFGSFPGVQLNPSAAVLTELDVTARPVAGHQLERIHLAASYAACARFVLQRLETDRFDIVVHLGVAGRAQALRLETTARNQVDSTLIDAAGESWKRGPVVPGGPSSLATSMPVASAHQDLVSKGFEVDLSQDAGAYVCNFLYYLSLESERRLRCSRQTVFLHLPAGGHAVCEHAGAAVVSLLGFAVLSRRRLRAQ